MVFSPYRSKVLSRTVYVLLCVALVAFAASAQPGLEYSEEAERLFVDALLHFKTGDFAGAAGKFDRVFRFGNLHQRTTAALVMKGKAQLFSGDPLEAEKTLRLLLSQFPATAYRGDAEYTLGLVNLKLHSYERALEFFINAWKATAAQPHTGSLRQQVLTAVDSTSENFVSLEELQRIAAASAGAEKELLLLKFGKKQISVGHHNAASATFEKLQRDFPVSSFPQRVIDFENALNDRQVKIGLLLPLMQHSLQQGREKEIGIGLQEGVSFALEEYLGTPQPRKISLKLRDTESDPFVAARMFRELATDSAVIGVIGPAFSPEAFSISLPANELGLPVITPTANANGIASSGPYVFQANPDLETRARAMALYAVTKLNLKRLAVLASREPTSKTLAETFIQEATRRGARVLVTEWYDRGETDLTQQLTNLRWKSTSQDPYLSFNGRVTLKDVSKLSALGVPMRLLDSLMMRRSIVSATMLLGENARTMLAENGIPFTIGDPAIDSLQHVVTSIEGLYCPINSPSEIGVISSQVAFFGIETRLLGSGEWNSFTELNANKRYAKEVIFESDTYTDSRELNVNDFSTRFLHRFGKFPNRNNFYGYDVARLLLSVLDKRLSTRDQLRNDLAEIRSFKTLHSRISFAPRRVNSWLHIMQYANESIHHISEIEVEH